MEDFSNVPDFAKLLQAKSRDDVVATLSSLVLGLGLEYFSTVQIQDRHGSAPTFRNSGNTPPEYQGGDYHDPALGQADPVMQHAKNSSLPLVWNRETYANAGAENVWENQANFGMRSGAIVATHMPRGRHFVIGFETQDECFGSQAEQAFRLAMLVTIAAYAQSALGAIDEVEGLGGRTLAPREVDCLHWSMMGKTAWETGQILEISERTVTQYIQSAMRKMEVETKIEAVCKAIKLGILN